MRHSISAQENGRGSSHGLGEEPPTLGVLELIFRECKKQCEAWGAARVQVCAGKRSWQKKDSERTENEEHATGSSGRLSGKTETV